ncbi:MAG: hypothetical protein A2351_00220 [Omnitrophica bacterium RIFOXYB12_FULL_50_7]|nr:MAG: hypothetical protein A2351_00220 [Omnitrophica bacterium RIFOXYB12_FULL_50_7]
MGETTKQETKTKPCCCVALVGVLVIVFAWWPVSWGAIALTILGAIIILKELIGQCCCKSSTCKPKITS